MTPHFENRETWATQDGALVWRPVWSWDVSRTHRLSHLHMRRVPRLFALFAKRWDLLAQAELGNHMLIALGIVGLQIVEQATPLAHQHEKPAARTVVFQVRFEMFRQLTNALA